MIRFILKHKYKDQHNSAESEHFWTIDGDLERLENAMKSGGYSENEYEFNEFIGIEIIENKNNHENI